MSTYSYFDTFTDCVTSDRGEDKVSFRHNGFSCAISKASIQNSIYTVLAYCDEINILLWSNLMVTIKNFTNLFNSLSQLNLQTFKCNFLKNQCSCAILV